MHVYGYTHTPAAGTGTRRKIASLLLSEPTGFSFPWSCCVCVCVCVCVTHAHAHSHTNTNTYMLSSTEFMFGAEYA